VVLDPLGFIDLRFTSPNPRVCLLEAEVPGSELLNEVLEKAAVTAIRLDISEEQASQLFQKLYRKHGRKA